MNKRLMLVTWFMLIATALFGNPSIAEARVANDTTPITTVHQTVYKIAKKPPGCNRRNQHPSKHIANISQQRRVDFPFGMTTSWNTMRFTMGTMYINCVQPGRDKVLPKWESACWTFVDRILPGTKFWFDGVTFNKYIWSPSNGHSVNPGKFKVDDIRGRQNCETHDIPKSQEEWLWGNRLHSERRDARHRSTYTVNLRAPEDDPAYSTGTYVFQPRTDIRLP